MDLYKQLLAHPGELNLLGDSQFILLDFGRIRSLGWRPKFTIREAVVETVDCLISHRELLDAR